MTLIEAINTDRPFRRVNETQWWYSDPARKGHIIAYDMLDRFYTFPATAENICAIDYEVLYRPKVTITLEHLETALLHAGESPLHISMDMLWDALCQLGELGDDHESD